MYCSKCGNTLPDDSLICGYCGVVVADGQEPREDFPQSSPTAKDSVQQKTLEENVPMLTQEQIESLPVYSAKVEEMVDLCSAAADHFRENPPENAVVSQQVDSIPTDKQQSEPAPQYEEDAKEEAVMAVSPAVRRMVGTDKRARPMRTAGFFGTQLLLLIPVINIILLFVWAFRRRSNFNRKAYARSILIWILIVLLLMLAGLIAMIILRVPTDINYWIDQLKTAVNRIPYV